MSQGGFTLLSKRIYPGEGEPFEGFVTVRGGTIAALGHRYFVPQGDSVSDSAGDASKPSGCVSAASGREIVIDVGENAVVPGLIDLHVHGSGGHGAHGGMRALEAMARFLVLHGVTAFQPTLGAAPLPELEAGIAAVREFTSGCKQGDREEPEPERAGHQVPPVGAESLGLHLEGPFLSPEFPGAMPKECLLAPDTGLLARWTQGVQHGISRVTLAPELPGAPQAIRYLTERGITVSMGHTAASFDEAVLGFRRGITTVTHTLNAMRGFHHRDPGALGAALTYGEVFCEAIADCVHVHPAALRLLLASRGAGSVILVSDAMPAAGLLPGPYEFLGRRVTLGTDGKVTLEDGTLAGSSALLLKCLRNMVEEVGVPFVEALPMATVNPAKAAGVFDRKGSLAPGKDADVLVLSDDYKVLGCWAKGKEVWRYGQDESCFL
jgi:N-acetylglucosamine-6-phosphate deacetylase